MTQVGHVRDGKETCSRCNGTGREPDWVGVGRRFRKRRLELGWSLREVAKRAKCSHVHISQLERGMFSWNGEAAIRAWREVMVKA